MPRFVYHLNGDRVDNRIENLGGGEMKDVKGRFNASNVGGVRYNSYQSTHMWVSNIRYKGEDVHLGNFKTIGEAKAEYDRALAQIVSLSN